MARFRMIGAVCCAMAALLLTTSAPVGAADVTVVPSETYQTIDGFGAFGSMPKLNRRAGNFWEPRPDSYELDRFITDLGASAVRFELPPSVYPVEGEAYDWSGSVFGTGGMTNSFRLMREFIARGTNRFIFSIWSPPCWMKISGECNGPYEASASSGPLDNILKTEYYDDLAKFIADFCVTVRDSVGVEPYAVSVQNEPYFHEPYNSCVYYEDKLDQLVTLTAQELDNRGLGTMIYGAEHMFNNKTNYYGLMLDNAGLDVWAMHGYTNGVNPDYGTATDWEQVYATVSGKGKKLWMTETTDPGSYMFTAKTLHAAFKSGKVSLWTWWAYADNMGDYERDTVSKVDTAFAPNGNYLASRHYFRFVRPGATMVGCNSAQTDLWATAFKNPDNTYVIVLVNTASSATTADVQGTGMPSTWQRYETSGGRNCEHTGSVGSSNVSVPGLSVVTLFSGEPVPVLPADTTANSVAEPTPSNVIGELNLKGDDEVDIYVNGNKVELGDDLKGVVSLNQGQNVIACKLFNRAWGGGLLSSMLLPQNDTMRTGTDWKFTYVEPSGDWTGLTYDDSQWRPANDIGPVDIWPGFAKWGLSAVNLYYQKARWLYCDSKMYFRKNVSAGSDQALKVFGNNFSYKCYIDGVLIKESNSLNDCDDPSTDKVEICLEREPEIIGTLPAGNHCLSWEITESDVDGNGVLFKGYTQTGRTDFPICVDTTWKCYPDLEQGWNTAGFNDDHWFGVDTIHAWQGRSPSNDYVPYAYPNTFWYRHVFNSAEATNMVINVIKPNQLKQIKKVEYFDLRGRRITAPMRGGNIANSLILQRTIRKDGAREAMKMLRQER